MRLSHRFLNTLHGPLRHRIFFLHIPKCAGSSLSNAIAKNYISLNIKNDKGIIRVPAEAAANVRQILNEEESPEALVSSDCSVRIPEYLLLYFMNQKRVKFVSGHVPFSEIAYRNFHQQFSFITIVRDPVKRWLSEYMFNKFKKSMHRKETANLDIDAYMNSEVGMEQGRQYVLFLGGRVNSEDYNSKAAMRRTIENLKKFSVIGCVENMKDFAERFDEHFGMKLDIGNENTNPRPEEWEQQNITDEIRRKIENICERDCEIFYRIQQHLKSGL